MTGPAPTVTAAEADLLQVARAVVGLCAWEAVEPLIGRGGARPAALHAPAGRLLEETLSRGLVQMLARRGGARPLQFLGSQGNPAAAGRLWQRREPPVFRFTASSLALLRWLLGGNLRSVDVAPLRARPQTLADQLLVIFALDGLATLDGELGPAHLSGALAAQEEVRGLPLAWLTACPVLAVAGATPPAAPAWASMFADEQAGGSTLALEALAPDLTRRWLAAARRKRAISAPALAVRIGTAEIAVLAAFMEAASRANRRDLALWIADTGGRLCARPLPVEALVGALDPQAPLSDRLAARRASGALLGALAQWTRWDGEHRNIGFLDDGHAAAQFLLARYEALASPAVANARAAQAELERLALGTAAPFAVERTPAP
ncbi:MAG TPA: hypothetical protein VN903_03975 [Polyangia bacterium]|jgi:hypothetical protein|nr:hypothetical protein [Polyangia bacterium]